MDPPPVHEVPSHCWNYHVENNSDRLAMPLLWTNSPKARDRKGGLKRCVKAVVDQFWEKWSHHWEGKSFLQEFFKNIFYCLRHLRVWGSYASGQADIVHYFAKKWVFQCGYPMAQAGCARHWGQWGSDFQRSEPTQNQQRNSLSSACLNSIKEMQPEFKIHLFWSSEAAGALLRGQSALKQKQPCPWVRLTQSCISEHVHSNKQWASV